MILYALYVREPALQLVLTGMSSILTNFMYLLLSVMRRFMLCNFYGRLCCMHNHCKENETPDMEVSNRMDIVDGYYRGTSFSIALKSWIRG